MSVETASCIELMYTFVTLRFTLAVSTGGEEGYTRVLSKAGPSSLELVNEFRRLVRKRCDGDEAFAEEDEGIVVRTEEGGLVYRIEGPVAF